MHRYLLVCRNQEQFFLKKAKVAESRKKDVQCENSAEKSVTTSKEKIEGDHSCRLYILRLNVIVLQRRVLRTTRTDKVHNRVPGENFSAVKKSISGSMIMQVENQRCRESPILSTLVDTQDYKDVWRKRKVIRFQDL